MVYSNTMRDRTRFDNEIIIIGRLGIPTISPCMVKHPRGRKTTNSVHYNHTIVTTVIIHTFCMPCQAMPVSMISNAMQCHPY